MEQYLCLKASAGSGKTFALTVRYISLLLQNVDVSSILTLTFTNKAALEMSERIYSTLNTLGDY
jgi:exodeoxyribonuclease V beta subunit